MYDLVRGRSFIDDLWNDNDNGPAICFTNAEIRKMLRLAKAGPQDTLLDLGSGWGQTLIVALTEFGVKRVMGVEILPSRYKTARDRLERWSVRRPDIRRDRWEIVRKHFDSVLTEKDETIRLKDATIVYYALETDKWMMDRIVKAWRGLKGNRRLVYYYNCLFPEIMPDEIDYPFCVSNFPFRAPSSAVGWLEMVTGKAKSSIKKDARPLEDELWDELKHDYRLKGDPDDVSRYKHRLNQALRKTRKQAPDRN